MDLYSPSTKILYSCQCEKQLSLPELYYCHSCQKNTCKWCVIEEIDSYYCPNCLENMASAEAILNHNRCKKCFECPVCFNALAYSQNGDTYFLNCGLCHWNSISIGMVSNNPLVKKEVAPAQQAEFQRALDLVQKEAREAQVYKDKTRTTASRRKQPTRDSTLFDPEAQQSASAPTPPTPSPATRLPVTIAEFEKIMEDKANFAVVPKSTPNLEPIPSIYYESSNASAVTTLEQRLTQPQQQAFLVKDAIPVKKLLHTRRSKRCKKCDRLLIKPELNPTKIEFKRGHFAYATIPKIMLAHPPVKHNNGLKALLVFTNPLHALVKMSFPLSSCTPQSHHNAKVELSPDNTYISGVLEVDEEEPEEVAALKATDNPRFIVERNKNKVFIALQLEPVGGSTLQGKIRFGFGMQIQFKDPVAGDQHTSFRLDFETETQDS